MLFLTALPLYADTFRFMYDIFGDKTLMYAHRVFGVIFIATPIIGFFISSLVNPKAFIKLLWGACCTPSLT